MEFDIVESNDRLIHVAVRGRLDVARTATLEIELNRLSARRLSVIMDLGGVDFIASLVIGQIVAFSRGLSRWDRRLVLVGPTPVVDKVLRTTGIDRVIAIAEDAAAARALIAMP
jgi:anti-anti-sigma factor